MAYKDYTSAIDILKIDGHDEVVGTPTVTILEVDSSNNVLFARGATVPTVGDTGYAVGCLFIDTDSGIGTTLYINEGSATSADFNAIETPESSITGVTAGSGISGGGTSGTVTVAVDSSIPHNLILSGTSIVIGKATGSASVLCPIKFAYAGTAILVTPTAMTSLIDFATVSGICSVTTESTATASTAYTHRIACSITGVGTRYLYLYSS